MAIKKSELEQRGLTKFDRDYIYLTGSQKEVVRTIYIDGAGRSWAEWYGDLIEVQPRTHYGYKTVLQY